MTAEWSESLKAILQANWVINLWVRGKFLRLDEKSWCGRYAWWSEATTFEP